MRTNTFWAAGTAVALGVMAIGLVQNGSNQQDSATRAEERPRAGRGPDPGDLGPLLINGLKATDGCLGVDAGQMMSGKNVIFAWFENKEAALRWHYSETHRELMRAFFPREKDRGGDRREPLAGVPDNVPLLIIASLTPAEASQFEETTIPVSQIAIEVYAPVNGGLALGGRFAPDTVEVPDLRHYSLPKR